MKSRQFLSGIQGLANPMRNSRSHWVTTMGSLLVLSLSACVSPPAPKPDEGINIVLGSHSPDYTTIARKLSRRFPATTYRISGNPKRDQIVLSRLRQSKSSIVVAIGVDATKKVKNLAGKQIIFCQVFNYQALGLVDKNIKGVNVIPSPYRAFRIWKSLDPKLKTVGIVTGPDVSETMDNVRAGAQKNNIAIRHVIVKNDKETIQAYADLADKVQGYWLLPDNRVLSGKTLHELLSFSVREAKQVMVFTPNMLGIGGLLSVSAVPADVADKVAVRLTRDLEQDAVVGPSVSPLDRISAKINLVLANQLGIVVPNALKGLGYAP